MDGQLIRPRIAIVGSRGYSRMDKVIDYIKGLPVETIIVSGGAPGVDTLAERTALQRGMKTDIYRADWASLGRSAGIIRNRNIVENCDAVVAFWDGESAGTKFSIELAQKIGKPVTIFDSYGRNNHGNSRKDQRDSEKGGKV